MTCFDIFSYCHICQTETYVHTDFMGLKLKTLHVRHCKIAAAQQSSNCSNIFLKLSTFFLVNSADILNYVNCGKTIVRA